MIYKFFNKVNISLFVLLFINFIFSLKYLSRFTDYFWLVSLIIIFFQYILVVKIDTLFNIFNKIKRHSFYLLIFISLILLFIASKVPIESLKVDRWSVVTSFWDNYFNNQYVYFAKSFDGNYPGPMPFYFVLFLPFYYLKEFSYITVIGLLLFYFILIYKKISEKNKFLFVVLIGISPYIFWETISRSNIFFNGTLVLCSTLYYLNFEKSSKALLFKGLLIGLVLSTRNVYVIVFVIASIYSFQFKKYNFVELFQIGCITIFTFVLTFVPFVYNHFEDFLKMNPFIIQSSALLPSKLSFFCIFLAAIVGFKVKSEIDVIFYTGIMLFFTIVLYFSYSIFITDFDTTFFKSRADISYFILCIPFVCFYFLNEYKSKQIQ